ncbi:MAG: hypothetical protein MN733_10835 [Nitrososphaera sp.]|nr:hypothetical protein [Nitrososphaera sp.]
MVTNEILERRLYELEKRLNKRIGELEKENEITQAKVAVYEARIKNLQDEEANCNADGTIIRSR